MEKVELERVLGRSWMKKARKGKLEARGDGTGPIEGDERGFRSKGMSGRLDCVQESCPRSAQGLKASWELWGGAEKDDFIRASVGEKMGG